MAGWLAGWLAGWMDGWMDGWMERPMTNMACIFRTKTSSTIYNNYSKIRKKMGQRLLTVTGIVRKQSSA